MTRRQRQAVERRVKGRLRKDAETCLERIDTLQLQAGTCDRDRADVLATWFEIQYWQGRSAGIAAGRRAVVRDRR